MARADGRRMTSLPITYAEDEPAMKQDLRQAALLDIEAQMDRIEFEVGAGRRSAASTFTKMRELVNAALVHLAACTSEGVSGSDVPARPTSLAEGFLCKAWGETDLPEARLVRTREEWEAFVVEAQWSEDTKYVNLDAEDREMVDAQVRYIAQDMADNGEGQINFEIGGMSVERVTFPSPPLPQERGAVPLNLDAKDAARYRWLRAGRYDIAFARSVLNDVPHGIDEAIDAAMLSLPASPGATQ